MTIQQIISDRRIERVLHFTTNRGLVGTLAQRSLLSRSRLHDEQYLEYVLHVNAARRPEAATDFDKEQDWLDYVNLSISEINRRYFRVSMHWHNNSDVWWCILSFDPEIMTHQHVFFATINNSYTLCKRNEGADGLESLFVGKIQRKLGWSVSRRSRPSHLPTCEQAEVLYPGKVSTEYLRCIYVEKDNHHDVACGWLKEFNLNGVDVVVSPQTFQGCPN